MGERTRSAVLEMFYGYFGSFRAGTMADIFSKNVSESVAPERSLEGKVIILDFPYHTHRTVGAFAQILYKRAWQNAMQRRNIDENNRPVFLWIDEYQIFADPDDQEFCTTARSNRVAPVFLTQNISNLYAAIGDENRVISMLGNLVTKIFHQNGDYKTNEYAVSVIAKTRRKKMVGDRRKQEVQQFEEKIIEQIIPHDFTLLESGGKSNDYYVEAIMTGDTYYAQTESGETKKQNYMRANFRQRFHSSEKQQQP